MAPYACASGVQVGLEHATPNTPNNPNMQYNLLPSLAVKPSQPHQHRSVLWSYAGEGQVGLQHDCEARDVRRPVCALYQARLQAPGGNLKIHKHAAVLQRSAAQYSLLFTAACLAAALAASAHAPCNDAGGDGDDDDVITPAWFTDSSPCMLTGHP